MNREDLIYMIGDDDLGLLLLKSKTASGMSSNERLISSFAEINNFVEVHKREPEIGSGVQEHQLASRLNSIREDEAKTKALLEYDEFDLLNREKKAIVSIKDVIDDDDIGLLGKDEADIFQLKNVKKFAEREPADFIAHRKPCKNFAEYEDLFIKCQSDLSTSKRRLVEFTSDKQIKEKTFFVLSGVLLYVDKIGITHEDKYGKIDGRQRCIFENGTESTMLFRSLVKRLYESGKAVSENVITIESNFFNNSTDQITNEDSQTGFIYVLKSLSDDPRIKSLGNLYKIGFSTTPVEERVKNASKDPTYLMAPVKIITTFECYNVNPQKLEQLLHQFFGSACINFDVFDYSGKRTTPREWFIAPLEVIEETVKLVINGGIINYKYDSKLQRIALR